MMVTHLLELSVWLGGLAVWLSALAFIVALCAMFYGHPPLRRTFVAVYQLALAFGRYLQRRLRGEAETAGPEELRHCFENLGPTYIKFGQLIASSSGLFPERYVKEFQHCLDRVPPEPWPVVAATLQRAFARPLTQIFRSIDEQPLASASIAQVYGAVGSDDSGSERELCIKVQRHGLRELVRADVGMLGFGAELLQQLPRVRNANPRGIVQQFERNIREALDFLGEAARMDELNRIMGEIGRGDVCAPRPVHRLCTKEVLVMERLRGIRVDDVTEIRRRGITPEEAESKLITGMHAWFQCLIRYGFFHGDVHAGNLLLLDDGRIGFLDFGIIGRLDAARRRQVADYLLAFASRDFARLARTMAAMGAAVAKKSDAEWAAFAADLEEAFGPFLFGTIADIDYGAILTKMVRNSARHGTRLPDDFVLILRQLLYFDRYARLLAPSLNLLGDPRLLLTIGAELANL
jgi:predicted unusual protein kinase regulating ubiquinone biosynthesis (AarF/ABC1/UbiB family)